MNRHIKSLSYVAAYVPWCWCYCLSHKVHCSVVWFHAVAALCLAIRDTYILHHSGHVYDRIARASSSSHALLPPSLKPRSLPRVSLTRAAGLWVISARYLLSHGRHAQSPTSSKVTPVFLARRHSYSRGFYPHRKLNSALRRLSSAACRTRKATRVCQTFAATRQVLAPVHVSNPRTRRDRLTLPPY
jgi:hypothetical protein